MLRRFKNNNNNKIEQLGLRFVASSSSSSSTSTTSKPTVVIKPPRPLSAVEQLREETKEHDAYMNWVRKEQKVLTLHCTPKRACSATRLIKDRQNEPKAVQKAQGRGMIATKDVYTGNVVAAAPILECGLFGDKLVERAKRNPEGPTNPFRDSYMTMPDFRTCCKAAAQSAGFQDAFVAIQGNLAMCLALERCNPKSTIAPYLDTLPVPAVDDKHILELYKDVLGEDRDVYLGHYKDHHDFIVALHKEWLENTKRSDQIFVPPLQVLDWAWRTVVARQLPLPVYAKPMMSLEDQRAFGTGYHYMNWVSINEGNPDATLYPTLIPFFDLVDHGRVANVRLDIVTRKVKYGFGTGGDAEREANETMHHAPSKRSTEGFFGKMKRKVMTAAGIKGISGVDDGELVAYLELQAMTDIAAGEELFIKFNVEEHERAFTLYRHGFLPV